MPQTPKKVEGSEEWEMTSLIREIYLEEKEAKKEEDLEKRLNIQQTKVKPKVDEFFQRLKELVKIDKLRSQKLTEALQYSINHEEALREFLSDPEVPIDNGEAERRVKPIQQGRNNSGFSFSIEGATTRAIITSLIETAKVNGANPVVYLGYAMNRGQIWEDKLAKEVSNLKETLTPWSEEYKEYASQNPLINPEILEVLKLIVLPKESNLDPEQTQDL